jgi:hypothetical protein
MLRHDESMAASPRDLAMIERLSGEHAPDRAAFKRVEINLVMDGDWFKGRRPNTKRWESFGWSVVDDPWAEIDAEHRKQEALRQQGLAKLTPEERAALGLKLAA